MITVPTNCPLISISFCGGTGYNIGHTFIKLVESMPIIQETCAFHFLDTSTANDTPSNTSDNTMVLGTGNGSGQVRGENADAIKDAMPMVNRKFKPGIFNIQVGSISGGSGSTIMNVQAAYMMEKGLKVITLASGSTDSQREVLNTKQTLLSFAKTSKRLQRPALVHYRENQPTVSLATSNANLINNLLLLTLVLSGKDDKFDISDLGNLFDYQKVTPHQPNLVGLDVYTGTPDVTTEIILAVATVALAETETRLDPKPPYHIVGRLHGEYARILKDSQLIHWCVLGNAFTQVIRELDQEIDAVKTTPVVMDDYTEGADDGDDLEL